MPPRHQWAEALVGRIGADAPEPKGQRRRGQKGAKAPSRDRKCKRGVDHVVQGFAEPRYQEDAGDADGDADEPRSGGVADRRQAPVWPRRREQAAREAEGHRDARDIDPDRIEHRLDAQTREIGGVEPVDHRIRQSNRGNGDDQRNPPRAENLQEAARLGDRLTAREKAQREPRKRDVGEKDSRKAKPEPQPAPAFETGVDPRRPIAEQFDDVVDVPRRLAPDVSPQRGVGDAGRALEKGCREQGAPPRSDVRLHLLGPDGEQLGALQKLVGVAETLLLGGALIGDAGIFRRRFVVRRRPQLVQPRLDFRQARRDLIGGGVDGVGDRRDQLTRGDEIGVGQIVAIERGLYVVERGVRLVERLAEAREVRGRGRGGRGGGRRRGFA